MTDADTQPKMSGIVTARKCECCGHHEIGFVNRDGEFIAFKPGTQVVVIDPEASESE